MHSTVMNFHLFRCRTSFQLEKVTRPRVSTISVHPIVPYRTSPSFSSANCRFFSRNGTINFKFTQILFKKKKSLDEIESTYEDEAEALMNEYNSYSKDPEEDFEQDEEDLNKIELIPGLYLVGTPIGNMKDITLRALQAIQNADIIATERPNKTQKIAEKHELELKPDVRVMIFNNKSPPYKVGEILDEITLNKKVVVVVSEAGMPVISDPGYDLVATAHERNIKVFVIPGPSSVVSALAGSGFNADRFVFEGFLPKKNKRRKLFERLKTEDKPIVFFESPHRILSTVEDCVAVFGPHRKATIAREITKKFEEFKRGTLQELLERLQKRTKKGEFTIVISPPSKEETRALKQQARQRRKLKEIKLLEEFAKAQGIDKKVEEDDLKFVPIEEDENLDDKKMSQEINAQSLELLQAKKQRRKERKQAIKKQNANRKDGTQGKNHKSVKK